MHRTLCRVIRGTCRKLQGNECPAVSTEEVRKGGHNKNEEFVPPPKHSLSDGIGLTVGLVLAYEVTHGRRRACSTVKEECPPLSALRRLKQLHSENSKCPFGWPTKAITQPVLSQSQSVVQVKTNRNREFKKSSIDLTPFIQEDSVLDLDSARRPLTSEEEDDSVQFSNNFENTSSLRASTYLTTKKTDVQVDNVTTAEKLSGDLMSILGAFKFLSTNTQKKESVNNLSWTINSNNKVEEPPLSAMELLEKGAELGSARALFNIGVAYERLDEVQIAKEYYRKAADLGHPLATYNNAVFLLKDGRFAEGLTMMTVAAENGVPEAQKISKSLNLSH